MLPGSFFGIGQCTIRVLFPKINARAEPIPRIVARPKFIGTV
jgi:hypothetical protein